MKVRQGFVSNSSSSSFILNKRNLTELQKKMIEDHITVANMFLRSNVDPESGQTFGKRDKPEPFDKYDEWSIDDNGDTYRCHTTMDNFYLRDFLEVIGVKDEDISNEWHS